MILLVSPVFPFLLVWPMFAIVQYLDLISLFQKSTRLIYSWLMTQKKREKYSSLFLIYEFREKLFGQFWGLLNGAAKVTFLSHKSFPHLCFHYRSIYSHDSQLCWIFSIQFKSRGGGDFGKPGSGEICTTCSSMWRLAERIGVVQPGEGSRDTLYQPYIST